MILVKKVGSQESGFSGSKPKQRGSYLLISKSWLANFPVLSSTHENDAALVVLDCAGHGRVVLPFVWHNSKKFRDQSNGRDEHRLYITGMGRAGIPCPDPGDLVLLQPLAETDGNQFKDHFGFLVIRTTDSVHPELMAAAPPGSNYWQISGDLSSFLNYGQTGPGHLGIAVADPSQPDAASDFATDDPARSEDSLSEQVPVSLDSSEVAARLGNTPTEVLAMRISSQTFRDVVLASYSGRCAITGKALQVGGHLNVEAAHIQPRAHDGSNLPSNGIALSRDLHWGFDKGAFTFTEDLRVEVHPDLMDTDWREFKGLTLQVPDIQFFRPSQESVRHHRTRVYGRFRHTGALRRLAED